jgi:hypothetical protein
MQQNCQSLSYTCLRQVGDTALVLAVCLERWPSAELLFSRGGAALLQARDMLCWTPLHQALACLAKAADPEAAAAWVKIASATNEQVLMAAQTEIDASASVDSDAAAAGSALEQFRGEPGGVRVGVDGTAVFRWSSTVLARCFCPLGCKGYYELEVLDEGLFDPCWGFCSGDWARGESHDVGTDLEGLSWGIDGDGALKKHKGGSEPFGVRWRKGDVLGLACELPPANLDAPGQDNPVCDDGGDGGDKGCGVGGGGRILVSVNGDFAPPNGVAFVLPPGLAGLHPAFYCLTGAVRCNLGGDAALPFLHASPTPDYQPMAAYPLAPAPPA